MLCNRCNAWHGRYADCRPRPGLWQSWADCARYVATAVLSAAACYGLIVAWLAR